MAETPARQSRWIAFAGIAFALLLAGFGIWLTQASDRVVGFDTQRNGHDLRIVADGLARWPTTVAQMAEKNFIPQRLEAADPALAARGWQVQARFWHPELGRFAVRYARLATCPDPGPAGRLTWFADGRLAVRGTLALADLETADRPIVAGLAPGRDGWLAWLTTARKRRGALSLAGTAAQLCFAADLPIERLVALETTAPHVASLLIADASGQVAAQVSGDPLAVADLAQLRAAPSVADSILGALPGAPKSATQPVAQRALDPLGPTRVHLGNHDYDAYLSIIALPGAKGTERVQIVGLVATGSLFGRIPRSPLILASFALPLLICSR